MVDDLRIIDLFFARAEEAISRLEEKYGRACISLSRAILNNEEDARECLNDTLLAVWNSIPPQRPNPLRAYVLKICRNISITKYHSNTAMKRNSYYDVALDELESCLSSPDTVESELDSKELSQHIDRFLEDLDKEGRVMFVRRYWYSDSVGEIAERFSISENNVYVRLSRIRAKLRKYLQKEGYKL